MFLSISLFPQNHPVCFEKTKNYMYVGANDILETCVLITRLRAVRLQPSNLCLQSGYKNSIYNKEVVYAGSIQCLSTLSKTIYYLRAAEIPNGESHAWRVAELCGFLASDKSSFITGSCIEITGEAFFLHSTAVHICWVYPSMEKQSCTIGFNYLTLSGWYCSHGNSQICMDRIENGGLYRW